ncbi:MAG TPA: serine/threonine-protein kinase, partial [Candidatus Polarisedimenticolaceae bacterium]
MHVAVGQDLGHYRLLEILGEGGMGVVWRALDTRLGREVAVKVLPDRFAADPVRRARFEREAKAVAALDHPNIVTLHAVEEADGVVFFTMELVRGETLARSIRPGGLPYEDLLRIALPLCRAVAAAHARGIVHRDLKPANIMVTAGGSIKILDFGLALLRGEPATGDATTESLAGAFSGTFGYAAPEQLRGERVDHRADLFALGAILHALATGEPLTPGSAPEDPAVANPTIPSAFGAILRRCLEKDPSRRFSSATELALALERLKEDPGRSEGHGSVAVLPFVDRSPAKDQAHLCDGIAEEILASLGRVPGLKVASRSSSFLYRDAAFDTREIAGRLGVSALLEGSVRRAGGRLRVTVHLVDARTDAAIWSESYDRDDEGVFGLQEEIARSVVAALDAVPGRGPLARAPTHDVQAYDYWLRGRRFYEQFGRSDIEFALQLFSRAVELDPGFAAAHAGLADCWSYLYRHAEGTPAALAEAEAASRRAIELDPASAPAWAARGTALSIAARDD